MLVVLQVLFLDRGIKADIHGKSFGTILSDFLFEIARSGNA